MTSSKNEIKFEIQANRQQFSSTVIKFKMTRSKQLPPRSNHEIAWRRKKAMELYPDMKGGLRRIGKILGFKMHPRKKDVVVMKEGDSDEVPTESDDPADVLTPIQHPQSIKAFKRREKKDRIKKDQIKKDQIKKDKIKKDKVMNEEDSSGKVPMHKKKMLWSPLDDKWQSVEEMNNLQEQFEKELNEYLFECKNE
jgi:hypothetical protein